MFLDYAIGQIRAFLNEWKRYTLNLSKNKQSHRPNESNLFCFYNQSRQQFMANNHRRKNKRYQFKKKVIGSPCIKALLLNGPSSSGKTISVKLIASEIGFDVVGYSSLDWIGRKMDREIVTIFDNQKLGWHCKAKQNLSWTQQQKFRFDLHLKSRLLVIEDADHIIAEHSKTIAAAIKASRVPIILVANNYKWNSGIAKLKRMRECKLVTFNRFKVIPQNIDRILPSQYNENNQIMQRLMHEFDGDLRASLGLLQCMFAFIINHG